MHVGVIIAVVVGVVILLAITGWWRIALRPFGIPVRNMTVERLKLAISSPEDVDRINTLLRSFSGGFNAMISSASIGGARRYCDSLPSLFQPFAQEGHAMGFVLRRPLGHSPRRFEEEVVGRRPGFRYLHYVGVGFWAGMRNHSAERLATVVRQLDPLHGCLCYDGYGFKQAFFDYREQLIEGREPDLAPLDAFTGYARSAAYQGVGRAFWFLFMDRIDELVDHAERVYPFAAEVGAGLGLASVFTHPDRLEVAINVGRQVPEAWHDHFHLGMCFGLKARSICDPKAFEQYMGRLDPGVRDAALASVRECDRVELEVRSEGGEDQYRRWRERVAAWMADHMLYPLAGLKHAETGAAQVRAAAS
jgi:hypothetical protein